MRRVAAAVVAVLAAVVMAGAVAAMPQQWARAWPVTDFAITSVADWAEIVEGGPPRDGIPALNAPAFHPVRDEQDLDDREPVITVALGDALPRAYPLRYLIWHEVVNDRVGDMPILVTYCPLCNSGLVFDRRTAAGVLSFGVTGKLRRSDMIMYDRETESWWQQTTGEGIVGAHTGLTLAPVPAWMESWAAFRDRNPTGAVMSRPEAMRRDYGANPYVGYDSATRPMLYTGDPPPHDIPALARVVRVGERAWPLARLAEAGEIAEAGVVLTWRAGLGSALDSARIADGAETGMVRVRDADGADLPHDVLFAFAFDAFWPDGSWMLGD